MRSCFASSATIDGGISGTYLCGMDIPTYRKEKGLSQAAFAALLTKTGAPATQSLVSQWESGDTSITADRAVQIEKATRKAVNRSDLRPDLFAPRRRRSAA